VTLTHDDTTTEDVADADFTAKNITTNPAHGNHLVHVTHDGQPVTITYGDLTPVTTTTLTVNKANPSVTWPTATAITYGAALSTSTLTGGVGAGSFAWSNGATIPTVTNNGYEVTFTPNDTTNYNTLTQNVSIRVLLGVEMVHVGAGSFQMGQNGNGSTGNVTPVHTVTLSGFSIGKYEVTQEQYEAVMGSLPSQLTTGTNYGRGDNYPVYSVSWYDALVFCNKLSMAEGLTPAYRISNSTDPSVWGTVPTISNTTWNAVEVVSGSNGYRLPTEAQWEYAAKGGPSASNPYKIYSGSDTVGDVAWYDGNNGSSGTATYGSKQVGTKAANELGIHDMSGNVYEWCWDWYDTYLNEAQTDPVGTSSGSIRVRRGGNWSDSATNVRSAGRNFINPYGRYYGIGFRLLCP